MPRSSMKCWPPRFPAQDDRTDGADPRQISATARSLKTSANSERHSSSRGVAVSRRFGSAIVDHDVRVLVETGRVDQPVRPLIMRPERGRPGLPESVRGRPQGIGRDAHPGRPVAAQLDESQGSLDHDLRTVPDVQFGHLDKPVAEPPVAAVAEDGFEEAHLERAPEIDDAETVGVRDALASVAEAARTTAEAERIRVARLVEASPDLSGRNLVEVERT